ncbi:hypothetical protein ABH974_006692 [Bradyrhizobium ottawaense]
MAGRRPQQRPAGLCRQQERRRQGGDCECGKEGRGRLLLSLPEPRHDGADERHRALHRGQMRGLVRHAEWRGGVRSGAGGFRPAGRQVRRAQGDVRGRFRPARPDRLCPPGRHDSQADAGHAGQAVVVARRGHGARPVSPDHPVQDDRRVRRRQQPGRAALSTVRAIDPVLAAPRSAAERHGSGRLPGRRPIRRSRVRLFGAEPAGRARDAQPARSARLLARRQRQSQRDLHGMLHGRAGPGRGPGPARIPPQADGQPSQASGSAQCGRREDRLEHAGAAGRLPRHRPGHGLWQLCRRRPPRSR